jgi:hypothetical protein
LHGLEVRINPISGKEMGFLHYGESTIEII